MSTFNVDQVARQIIDNGEAATRNIWLAGLGIYSRSIEEAQQLNSKTSDMFDDLVERGREVEQVTKKRIGLAKERTSDYVEEQVNDAVHRVSGIDRAKLDKLDDKIARLTQVVETLVAQKASEQPAQEVQKHD